MDIQIVSVQDPGDGFLYVMRRIDSAEILSPNIMPKETLAIRAAEYNLDVRDPMALDIMLLEPFMNQSDPIHPLYTCDRISEALEIIWGRVEDVRVMHGAPEEPAMRSLFLAADLEESTQGLTDTKTALLYHAPYDIAPWIQMNRDSARKQIDIQRNRNALTLTDIIKREALAPVIAEAEADNNRRIQLASDLLMPVESRRR